MKKVVAFVLTILLFSLTFTPAFALEQPQFELAAPDGTIGEEIEISLNIQNNPGITAFSLSIHYPAEQLQLLSASGSGSFAGGFSTGQIGTNPFKISWYNRSSLDVYDNGTAAILRFRVLELETAIVTLTYDEDDVFNADFDNQYFEVKPAVISNHTHTPAQAVRENELSPTCTEPGSYEQVVYCATCGAEISRQSIIVEALGHDYIHAVRHVNMPSDGSQTACVYYTCGRKCGAYIQASYDSVKRKYSPDENAPTQNDLESIIHAAQESIPSPIFNNFFDTDLNYAYSLRGSSLRYMAPALYTGESALQPLRFSGSVKIPDGVNYQVGSQGDNVVFDFGFVFSQDRYIGGASDLVLGRDNIYHMSVAENNVGISGGIKNWIGVTYHTNKESGGDSEFFTFNLIINIKAKNWGKNYVARPYITYRYHGAKYTVYDGAAVVDDSGRTYNCENVYELAQLIVASPRETLGMRNYCQNKIIDSYEQWSKL